MYDFAAEFRSNAAEVERGLDRLLAAGRLAGPGQAPQRLIDAMRHGSLDGGKRLRPLLVRQTAAVFGVDAAEALTAGLAVEMVHCYSLIHDDLPAMDDDDLRRGRATVHRAFDEATAILAGDALLTHALGLLAAEGHADPLLRMRLVEALAAGAGAGGMVGGQMRDIQGETTPLSDVAIAEMQSMKTGALIRTAVHMGSILGRASDDALHMLLSYGEKAGTAFQLADDILDVTASPEAMGKATGKDGQRGKQTLVSRIGLEGARRRLADLVHDAFTALLAFGPEADGLRATARYFATRES
jgi:farnesyl diphosphate synthase